MRASTFAFLNTIEDLEINDNTLTFTMCVGGTVVENESISAEIELSTKTVEGFNAMRPEYGCDVEVPTVKTKIAKVLDADNLHAIEGQPFELTCEQFRMLNEYLDEFVA